MLSSVIWHYSCFFSEGAEQRQQQNVCIRRGFRFWPLSAFAAELFQAAERGSCPDATSHSSSAAKRFRRETLSSSLGISDLEEARNDYMQETPTLVWRHRRDYMSVMHDMLVQCISLNKPFHRGRSETRKHQIRKHAKKLQSAYLNSQK